MQTSGQKQSSEDGGLGVCPVEVGRRGRGISRQDGPFGSSGGTGAAKTEFEEQWRNLSDETVGAGQWIWMRRSSASKGSK